MRKEPHIRCTLWDFYVLARNPGNRAHLIESITITDKEPCCVRTATYRWWFSGMPTPFLQRDTLPDTLESFFREPGRAVQGDRELLVRSLEEALRHYARVLGDMSTACVTWGVKHRGMDR